MKVDVVRNAKPPDDIATLYDLGILNRRRHGEWLRFHTTHAYAYVFVAEDLLGHGGYLLHWIESRLPNRGEGSSVLAAIGQFADIHHLSGHLVCEPDLVGWYEKFGWERFGEFNDSVAMARFYTPSR